MSRTHVAPLFSVLLVLSVVTAACIAPVDEEEFIFGVILVGAQNDHGWSEAHFAAGGYAVEHVPGTRMIVLDRLNASERPGTTLEQVVDEMVAQGARLIFTTADTLAANTDLAASVHPDVWFVNVAGDHVLTGEAPGNVANYMAKMEYMQAIAGCAAALKTETATVGYLGPLMNAERRRLAAAAYLGYSHCYDAHRRPDAAEPRFLVNDLATWLGMGGAPPDPSALADALFDAGADVIVSGIDTTEAIVKAGQRYDQGEQVWAVPYDYQGACAAKPEVCLGTPCFNWGPAYVEFVTQARSGDFRGGWVWADPYWPDLNNRDLSPVGFVFGEALADEDRGRLEAYIGQLARGERQLFAEPLRLADGTLYIPAWRTASDEEIWYLPDLLEGMETLGP